MEFTNRAGIAVVTAIIEAVCSNRDYLSRIDALVGDGDHGINMSKGFAMAGEELGELDADMSEGLLTISSILVSKIGGSMGPLYGSFFRGMAAASKDEPVIHAAVLQNMLQKAYSRIAMLTSAQVGDKTLIDVLDPAVKAYEEAAAGGGNMEVCLKRMLDAAKRGLESTKELAAKVGRGSRLGERAIGHQDAGATSCYIILEALAEASLQLVKAEEGGV
ncbi:dihydroxyacetone kinase subunit DhaL [Paenibacillus ihumii]|uniref:dihydroxyacetone kinase subunit DhaL n=1 Tax=Paenibacillus ihumii TaxID=687436 RepID=UPI0006D78520|nr:dihydroxyacetone kinase subunit DhaL [Paenibacillus ihumii]